MIFRTLLALCRPLDFPIDSLLFQNYCLNYLYCISEVLQQVKCTMELVVKKAFYFAFYELHVSIYKLTVLKFQMLIVRL